MKNKGFRNVSRTALKAVDMFSFDVQFRENKQEKFTTCFGSVMSLFIIVLVGYYSTIKYEVLRTYGDTKFQKIEEYGGSIPIKYDGGDDKNFPLGLLYVEFEQEPNNEIDEFFASEELMTQRDLVNLLDIKMVFIEEGDGDEGESFIQDQVIV